jgi:hypothetical protein
MTLLTCLAMMTLISNAQVLYEEHFTGGVTNLAWQAAFVDSTGIGNNMQVELDPTSPGGGDLFVGKLGNDLSGGNVGLTYAGDSLLTDYTLTAWVFATVSAGTGPYNSLVFRYTSIFTYYQLDTDFDSSQRLRFRNRNGDLPLVIRDWTAAEIPGGIPTTSSWHKMTIRMVGNQFWLYWDDVILPGCPYTDDTHTRGYFGAYIFNMLSTTSVTKVEDVVVSSSESAAPPTITILPTNAGLLAAYPNPFNPSTNLTFTLDRSAAVKLSIFDAQGRPISTLINGQILQSGQHTMPWNAGNLPAGVYLTRLEAGNQSVSQRVVLVK